MSEREPARSDCRGEQRPLPAFHPPHTPSSTGLFFLLLLQRQTAPANAAFLVHCSLESYSQDRASSPPRGCGCRSSSLKNRLRSGQAFITGLRARLLPPNSCPPASYSPSPLCPPPTWRLWKRLTPLLSKIKCCLSALKLSNSEQVIRFPQVFTFNFSTLLTL